MFYVLGNHNVVHNLKGIYTWFAFFNISLKSFDCKCNQALQSS